MADVAVWPACDVACAFCSNPAGEYRRPLAEHSLPSLVRRLTRWKAGLERFHKFDAARDNVTLTGGEPTLHPRILPLLAAVRRQFPGVLVRLLTHGRRLADASFAKRVLEAAGAPFEAAVNLSGPEDGLERSFAGALNLLCLRRPGQRVSARYVLTRETLGRLGPLAAKMAEKLPGLSGLAVLFPEFEGRALASPEALGLRLTEAATVLEDLAPALSKAGPLSLYHFPVCVLGPRLRPLAAKTLDDAKVVFSLACRGCRRRAACVGIHKSYARVAGCGEFRP
ncbi:radical SAM protein [bacterium]|nr:MAG: radical SAM protein [bacterium]